MTHCLICNDPYTWASPYCQPPKAPVVITPVKQPYNPRWLLPALERLEIALKKESKHEREKWQQQINYMREVIADYSEDKP